MNNQELKNHIKATSKDIEEIVSAYCDERKLSLLDRRTRYSPTGDMTVTLTIAPKNLKVKCSLEDLKRGFAPVGTRIKVWWKSESVWYNGTISKRGARGKYNVTFDDGEYWRILFTNAEFE